MSGDPMRTIPSPFCGHDTLQWYADFVLWENVLNLNPQVGRIVEIGTGGGAFSMYLACQARERGLGFHTFDWVEHPGPKPGGFVVVDVFERPESVFALLDCPVVLHCDNGDKPRELRLFASQLFEGSVCVVHDWNREAFAQDLPPNLTAVHEELWLEEGVSMCGVFRSSGKVLW